MSRGQLRSASADELDSSGGIDRDVFDRERLLQLEKKLAGESSSLLLMPKCSASEAKGLETTAKVEQWLLQAERTFIGLVRVRDEKQGMCLKKIVWCLVTVV